MRDLIEAHDAFGRAMLADLTGRDGTPTGLGLSVTAIGDGPATSVWSGDGNGRHRPPDEIGCAMASGLRPHIVMDAATTDALMLAARAYVGAVWDQAVALAAEAGPMPLAGTESWVEGDGEYERRLCAAAGWENVHSDWGLEGAGWFLRLPRARLVQVEG